MRTSAHAREGASMRESLSVELTLIFVKRHIVSFLFAYLCNRYSIYLLKQLFMKKNFTLILMGLFLLVGGGKRSELQEMGLHKVECHDNC